MLTISCCLTPHTYKGFTAEGTVLPLMTPLSPLGAALLPPCRKCKLFHPRAGFLGGMSPFTTDMVDSLAPFSPRLLPADAPEIRTDLSFWSACIASQRCPGTPSAEQSSLPGWPVPQSWPVSIDQRTGHTRLQYHMGMNEASFQGEKLLH